MIMWPKTLEATCSSTLQKNFTVTKVLVTTCPFQGCLVIFHCNTLITLSGYTDLLHWVTFWVLTEEIIWDCNINSAIQCTEWKAVRYPKKWEVAHTSPNWGGIAMLPWVWYLTDEQCNAERPISRSNLCLTCADKNRYYTGQKARYWILIFCPN